MGFRFRKSIRIFPGFRINLSKSGVSASVGGAPLSLNVSRRGVRSTASIPGTGLSYSSFSPAETESPAPKAIDPHYRGLLGNRPGSLRDTGAVEPAFDQPVYPRRTLGTRFWLAIVIVGAIIYVAGLLAELQKTPTTAPQIVDSPPPPTRNPIERAPRAIGPPLEILPPLARPTRPPPASGVRTPPRRASPTPTSGRRDRVR